jgi:hypothetical protein
MRAVAVVLVLALTAAGGAAAETFTSAYDPQPGERFELTVDKCRANSGEAEQCARTIYLEEVLEDASNGATRVRYAMQSMRFLNRETSPQEQQAFDFMARNTVLLFHTDEGGAPVLLENREQVMAFAMAVLPPGDDAARERVQTLMAGLSEEALAGMFGKDFSPASVFQAIEIEVGQPHTEALQLPFPFDERQQIAATATLAVTSIDREAGVAHATFRQALDPESASAATRAFLQNLTTGLESEAEARAVTADMRIERTDEISAVVDLASGRVTRLEMSSRTGASGGGEDRVRTERLTMTRRMLPNQ